MRNRQFLMQNALGRQKTGAVGFAAMKDVSAPFVSQHRMTLGVPDGEACFSGKFGISDIGDGQTVHCAVIDPDVEFETSFMAQPGLVVTIVLEGKLEFALDGAAYCFDASDGPVAVAWVNLKPVSVTRRTRLNDPLSKVQIRTPLSFFDEVWRSGSNGFLDRHTELTHWQPSMEFANAAHKVLDGRAQTDLRARMMSSRLAVEALDALLAHLEIEDTGTIPARLAAARSYVEQTATERPNLAHIAAATGYSVSALQRAYRTAFGMTVIGHQRRLLLETAYQALQSGDLCIAQAAQAAGYNSPTNFTSAFIREFGFPPSRLRSTQG
ncbi:MAG: AraC family transcriptional regulator [Pseudomonadota bacterium]